MSSTPPPDDRAVSFMVCGLGGLGQQCVVLLKEFGVGVSAIEQAPSPRWRTPDLPGVLDRLVVGDCCQVEVLKRAGVEQCRAVLLLTGDERTNIAAAFAARSQNPKVRLIIRSAQENLNQLLRRQMGNLVAFEPSQFSANVFALASLGETTQALFDAGEAKIRVERRVIKQGEDWCKGRRLADLNTPFRRVLGHAAGTAPSPDSFHAWNPEDPIRDGDIVTFIENAERPEPPVRPRPSRARKDHRGAPSLARRFEALASGLKRRWRGGSQVRRVALASAVIMLGLLVAGIVLFREENPEISWFDAVNVSTVLAVGGFDNVFGALKLPFPISPGLYLFSVAMKIASAIFLGILFAMLTERILSARLQIARRRPNAPLAGHTIVIGMGAIGKRVAAILRDWGRPMVGLAEEPVSADVPSDIPIQIGPLRDTLERANIATASSVVIVTDDEVANLEISLMTRSFNPHCTVVFRTTDQQFARNAAALIPASVGIGDAAVAAEAITGTAFGEHILSAFHLDGRSVLVTEYTIEPGDTLIDRLLSEIAYGYGVAPIVHQRGDKTHVIPIDDIRLEADDRVVVLATIDGLRRVEAAKRVPPDWVLRIERSPSRDADFEASNAIARISGCDIPLARAAMTDLPATFAVPLYRHQGLRLVRELKSGFVTAHLEPDGRAVSTSAMPRQG